MPFIQRANVILEVSDEAAERYYKAGYSILDANGNVSKQALPSDIEELRVKYSELLAKVRQLERENEELKAAARKKKKD